MIKTGIHHIRQVQGRSRFKTLLGKDKNVSVTLYDQIRDLPNAESLAERILLLVSDDRGARKRTYSNRFEKFDATVLELARERFASDTALVIEDLAVSDARTSCDFFKRMAQHFPRLSYRASDYSPRVFVLEEGRLKVTLSRSQKVLEVTFPPFVFNSISPENPLYYPVNHALRTLLTRTLVRSLVNRYRAGEIRPRELLLFSVEAVKLSETDPRFRLGEHDLRTALPVAWGAHVVRAMNVLNPSYFDASELRQIIPHIHRGLVVGGLFVSGSNQDAGSGVNGGVYEKTHDGFRRVWLSEAGSPIESHLLGWKLEA